MIIPATGERTLVETFQVVLIDPCVGATILSTSLKNAETQVRTTLLLDTPTFTLQKVKKPNGVVVNSDLDCGRLTYAFSFSDTSLNPIGTLEANQLRIETTFVNDIYALFLISSSKEACFSAVAERQTSVKAVKSCFKITFKTA